jgi:hypothetical protein
MNKMEELTFVNILGEPVSLDASKNAKRKPKESRGSYHNGWRVQGIPPGALEEARQTHESDAAFLRSKGKEPKEWNEAHWLMNARRKPVRSKPYEVPEAARECAAIATRSGWLSVEVVELKKEAA